jgi:hypothetical protein
MAFLLLGFPWFFANKKPPLREHPVRRAARRIWLFGRAYDSLEFSGGTRLFQRVFTRSTLYLPEKDVDVKKNLGESGRRAV